MEQIVLTPSGLREIQPLSQDVFPEDAIQSNVSRANGLGNQDVFTENSPAVLTSVLEIPREALYVNFQYLVSGASAGDSLSLQFNDEMLFFAALPDIPQGSWIDSLFIDVSHIQGTTGVFSLVLNSDGDAGAQVIIEGLTFMGLSSNSVPEPSTMGMAVVGILCIHCVIRRRRLNHY